jgi:hypothetical protein
MTKTGNHTLTTSASSHLFASRVIGLVGDRLGGNDAKWLDIIETAHRGGGELIGAIRPPANRVELGRAYMGKPVSPSRRGGVRSDSLHTYASSHQNCIRLLSIEESRVIRSALEAL